MITRQEIIDMDDEKLLERMVVALEYLPQRSHAVFDDLNRIGASEETKEYFLLMTDLVFVTSSIASGLIEAFAKVTEESDGD